MNVVRDSGAVRHLSEQKCITTDHCMCTYLLYITFRCSVMMAASLIPEDGCDVSRRPDLYPGREKSCPERLAVMFGIASYKYDGSPSVSHLLICTILLIVPVPPRSPLVPLEEPRRFDLCELVRHITRRLSFGCWLSALPRRVPSLSETRSPLARINMVGVEHIRRKSLSFVGEISANAPSRKLSEQSRT